MVRTEQHSYRVGYVVPSIPSDQGVAGGVSRESSDGRGLRG
jgi:hypothetical protein